MAKYPVDPTPHLPPGTSVVAPNPHRPQRGYVVLSGGVPIICDEWAIATLAPPVENEEYGDALEIIRHFLTNRRLPVRFTSRCGSCVLFRKIEESTIERQSLLMMSGLCCLTIRLNVGTLKL
ncbi:uncharacterized protein LOC112272299 [Brachypodium distachyon]|uniref:uncharacterized protein LOC112272299 n=1 Tax=Brachypodium distachyon TaxID=15368 RepID=UPI000D0D1D24|nr:uncharacterized protein LOC112272299 [Brachypodium distachyon]|eukprot:XP_024318464.1 uncharacterized protein LOC112272299 [Brachypodium distachyon]